MLDVSLPPASALMVYWRSHDTMSPFNLNGGSQATLSLFSLLGYTWLLLHHDFMASVGTLYDHAQSCGPLAGVNVVYDPVGGAMFTEALKTCAWGAQYLVIGFAAGMPRCVERTCASGSCSAPLCTTCFRAADLSLHCTSAVALLENPVNGSQATGICIHLDIDPNSAA